MSSETHETATRSEAKRVAEIKEEAKLSLIASKFNAKLLNVGIGCAAQGWFEYISGETAKLVELPHVWIIVSRVIVDPRFNVEVCNLASQIRCIDVDGSESREPKPDFTDAFQLFSVTSVNFKVKKPLHFRVYATGTCLGGIGGVFVCAIFISEKGHDGLEFNREVARIFYVKINPEVPLAIFDKETRYSTQGHPRLLSSDRKPIQGTKYSSRGGEYKPCNTYYCLPRDVFRNHRHRIKRRFTVWQRLKARFGF